MTYRDERRVERVYLIEDDIIIEPVVVGVVVLHIVLLGFKTLLEQVIDETTLGLNLGVDRIIDLVQSTSLRSLEQSIQSRNRSEQRGTKSLHIIKNVVGRALRCSRGRVPHTWKKPIRPPLMRMASLRRRSRT